MFHNILKKCVFCFYLLKCAKCQQGHVGSKHCLSVLCTDWFSICLFHHLLKEDKNLPLSWLVCFSFQLSFALCILKLFFSFICYFLSFLTSFDWFTFPFIVFPSTNLKAIHNRYYSFSIYSTFYYPYFKVKYQPGSQPSFQTLQVVLITLSP